MTTYLITNAVTWVGLTSFQAGDKLIVTPGAALVMPDASLSDVGVAGATAINFAGYVYLHDLSVDQNVTFGITVSGQFISGSAGSAITLNGGHLDNAGQITASNGTAVQTLGVGASLSNAGRISAVEGVALGGTSASLMNLGTVEGTGVGVNVTANLALVTNIGSISSAGTAVSITLGTAGNSMDLVNAGHIQGDVTSSGLSDDHLSNTGTIAGTVDLGAGNDIYSGGKLSGDLKMGLGQDLVDARGNAVAGIIFDAGGADTYIIDSPLTRITDTGAGMDNVQSWCSFRLFDGLEVLNLRGTENLNGFGNDLANLITGTAGKNLLVGGAGADRLFGAAGDDVLNGGTGADNLMGGDGDDVLRGEQGKDFLTGGPGHDTFVFAALGDTSALAAGADTITDFIRGRDRIDVSAIDASSTNALANDAFTFIGLQNFTNSAGEVRFTLGAQDTTVEIDVNGDGVADAVINLLRAINLTAGDFVL